MTDYDFMLFPESNQLLEQLGFFFHAEDGIRVADVTGVQTCALPILPANVRATHRSLFDGTLQGIERTDRPAFSFQGHPEATPGPQDVAPLFSRFIEMMKARQA